MGFRVIERFPRTYWCATNGTGTYYIGQLVAFSAATQAATPGTVVPLAVPSGLGDQTNCQMIAGVVVGFNNRVQTVNSTGQYETAVVSQANQLARDWVGAEGMYAKGDPQMLVQVAEITPDTVVEGDLRAGAIGTAVTINTVSASTDIDGMISANTTVNTITHTPVANKGTIYCRTGTNAGLYRTNVSTSTTLPQVTTGFPYDVAVGDTFVIVGMKQGLSEIYIGGPGLYIDTTVSISSATTFNVLVYKLDLRVAGREVAQFRFGTEHFNWERINLD